MNYKQKTIMEALTCLASTKKYESTPEIVSDFMNEIAKTIKVHRIIYEGENLCRWVKAE